MMEQDALQKAKERLKSNYSKARSARHGAQVCQPAPAPRPRAAPPRQRDLTREAPTLSPALKAQGWAVKQSRSTGGYYYVHTANGREWSQWEPPVPERRSSPERAAAALFSDEDDDGSASDSEDEMPVSALLARQATANDEAIAQALADSPPKRSRRVTGGVGGRRGCYDGGDFGLGFRHAECFRCCCCSGGLGLRRSCGAAFFDGSGYGTTIGSRGGRCCVLRDFSRGVVLT